MNDSRFFMLSGGGNDFVALADPREDPQPAAVRALCQRGISLGADGFFVVRPDEEGVRMDYWNADGNPSGLCLNGTRCAARLAHQLGWCDESFLVITGVGAIEATVLGKDSVRLDVPVPSRSPEAVEVSFGQDDDDAWSGWKIRIGVPHFVLHWPSSLADAPVESLGSALRWAPDFAPAGTNVNFVRFPSPHDLEIRTFERGVEAETLACGTGILASVALGIAQEIAKLPMRVKTLGGFPFEVGGEAADGRPTRWSLTGDARLLAEGRLLPAALATPEPPEWTE